MPHLMTLLVCWTVTMAMLCLVRGGAIGVWTRKPTPLPECRPSAVWIIF